MNEERFDWWTQKLAEHGSRRLALRLLARSALGLTLAGKVLQAKADDDLPAILHPLLDDGTLVVDTDYSAHTDTHPERLLRNPERGMYFGSRPNTPQEFHTIVPKWLFLTNVCGEDLVWMGPAHDDTSQVLKVYATEVLEPARMNGYKVLFRPRYDQDDDTNGPSACTFEGGSAKVFHANSKARQKQHITAIATMLASYRDVIAFIQAGYLGKWGEWNWDGYSGDNAPLLANFTLRQEIIDWVIDEYDRVGIMQHIELRRPVFAKHVLDRPGMAHARVGYHNDCFMTDDSDYDTYGNFQRDEPLNFKDLSGDEKAEQEVWAAAKRWAQQTLTPRASFGGETCPIDADGDKFSDGTGRWRVCKDMTSPTSDPATLHMNYLNGDFVGDKCRPSGRPGGQCLADDVIVPGAVTTWTSGGCYDEILLGLGYRFVVKRVAYTRTVKVDQQFEVRVHVENAGWSRLHKPREAMLVLRNGTTKHVYTFSGGPVSNWAPGATTTISASDSPPPPGTYSVRLWLPDPDLLRLLKLLGQPDAYPTAQINYAVKLATVRKGINVFDAKWGENDLGVSITVQ